MSKVVISICFVSYKDRKNLIKAIKNILKYKPTVKFEIIVIDNDGELKPLNFKNTEIKYIKARSNRGYGAGNNLAISNALGEYVLVINADVTVTKDSITLLYDFLKTNKNVAGVGPAYQITNKRKVALGTGELTPLRAIFALGILNKVFPNNYFSKKYYLTTEDRLKIKSVWAIAGSFGMFRKKALIEAKKYDEKLFLYFEESDLGRRLKKLGYELYILPEVKIKHLVGGSTGREESQKIKDIFNNSRFYYFKKHFGILNALIVEAFSRVGKYELILLGISLFGLFLRVYRLKENMVFHGELGDNYLAMKNILSTGNIPLLGPPTSHPWLSFGPLFYWLFTPILFLLRFDPVNMSYFFAVLGTLLVLINYKFVKSLFDKKVAVISSLFIAVSPSLLYFTRESRFFSIVLLLFYPFIYTLFNNSFLLSGFWFGVMLNFHLSPLIYLPFVFIYIYKNNKRYLINFILGTLIPSIPFLISSLRNGGEMLTNSIIWIPYRIAGFLGLVSKNNLDEQTLSLNTQSLSAFFDSILVQKGYLIVIFLLLLIILIKKGKNTSWLMLLLLIGLIGIFIHGDAPAHYYLPLILPAIILISSSISRLNKYLLAFSLVLFSLLNFSYYFSNKWFYIDQSHVRPEIPVPYMLQLEASKQIIKDAQGYPYSLIRTGPGDNFEENYAQNYIYLLTLEGNSPKDNQITKYHIYEGLNPPDEENIIFNKGGLIVTR